MLALQFPQYVQTNTQRQVIWRFAFAGRSNVGKSSMINKLLNRKSLARVSGTPGKNNYD